VRSRILNLKLPESVELLPRDDSGFAFVSDIDKTYLATQIDSIGGLLRAAFENPERKRNVPGFSTLLRALRRGGKDEPERNPLWFVSASPPQLLPKLVEKMKIDRVEHDGLILKDQWAQIRRGQFRRLREHVGFKLSALLALWSRCPPQMKWVLFGDDSEADPIVFSLFAEIVALNITHHHLSALLIDLGVSREESVRIAWFSRQFKQARFPVRAAFINLETMSNPRYYPRLSPLLRPSENSLQMALALFESGLIRERAVKSIARELVLFFDIAPRLLGESLERGADWGLYSTATMDRIWTVLASEGWLPLPVAPNAERVAARRAPEPLHKEVQPLRYSVELIRRRYLEDLRYEAIPG
jgi:hypothetical protein